jgi:hypothetical protein
MNNKINNMPGFTAETSLYKTSGRYQVTITTHRVELNADLVQPSLAIYMDGRFVCNGEVTANGFINCYPLDGGGGGGGGGRPNLCLLCRRGCLREPLAKRAACRADCDDLC